MQTFAALLAGLLFGRSPTLSGMSDPSKVIGFLDLVGRWDSSLAFVMLGAIAVGAVAFRIGVPGKTSLLGESMHVETWRTIDRWLVLGGLTFGVGWGMAGYCPGPALTSILSGSMKPVLFVVAMIAGTAMFELLERLTQRKRETAA